MKNKVNGYISQIQRFSVNDGDGIRTTIFLSSCPLRCQWCSNPETWKRVWKHDVQHNSKVMTIEEVMNEVMKDSLFYRQSGGGITLSGGEATNQPVFLNALVDAIEYYGIHLALETSGQFEWTKVKDSLEKVDLIFWDLKHMNSEKHKAYCGIGNETILENARRLGTLKNDVVIRIPVIHDLNDDDENILSTALFVKTYLPDARIELLPYHNYGIYKYDLLGLSHLKHAFETPSNAHINHLEAIIRGAGIGIADYK